MTSEQVLGRNSGSSSQLSSHLYSRLNSQPSSSLLEKDADSARWLLRLLPDFGIVQLDGHRLASIVAQFEQLIDSPLVCWNASKPFSGYAEVLADVLDFPSAEHVYLQHRLRVWAEQGGVLWIFVEADTVPNELLVQLLRYRPLSRSGQYAIRILLKISNDKRNEQSLAPLAAEIHERVGGLPAVSAKSFTDRLLRYDTLSTGVPYFLILFLSVSSVLATLYIAPQEKGALTYIKAADIKVADIKAADIKALNEKPQLEMLESQASVALPATPLTEKIMTENRIESLLVNEKSEVLALIEQWSRAWQQQNIDEYFSMYSHGYSGHHFASPDEWRVWRKNRLKKPEWISIEIGPVVVEYKTEGELKGDLHATFWQLYRSPNYKDNTLKTLVLRKEAGVWKIVSEINEEVRPLSRE